MSGEPQLRITRGLLAAICTNPKYLKATRTVAARVIASAKKYKKRWSCSNREAIEHGLSLRSNYRGHEHLI